MICELEKMRKLNRGKIMNQLNLDNDKIWEDYVYGSLKMLKTWENSK